MREAKTDRTTRRIYISRPDWQLEKLGVAADQLCDHKKKHGITRLAMAVVRLRRDQLHEDGQDRRFMLQELADNVRDCQSSVLQQVFHQKSRMAGKRML